LYFEFDDGIGWRFCLCVESLNRCRANPNTREHRQSQRVFRFHDCICPFCSTARNTFARNAIEVQLMRSRVVRASRASPVSWPRAMSQMGQTEKNSM
jgi:hypothetical protein